MDAPKNSREHIIYELKRAGSATAKELADLLGISSTAIRQLLYALQAEGIVETREEKQPQGRPRHLYSLTAQGDELFPRAYDAMVMELLETVREMGGEEMMEAVMKKQLDKKEERYRDAMEGASLSERLQRLSELRKGDGFMSEIVQDDGKAPALLEHNCPVLRVAKAHPKMCAYEIELMERVLGMKLDHTQTHGRWRARLLLPRGGRRYASPRHVRQGGVGQAPTGRAPRYCSTTSTATCPPSSEAAKLTVPSSATAKLTSTDRIASPVTAIGPTVTVPNRCAFDVSTSRHAKSRSVMTS